MSVENSKTLVKYYFRPWFALEQENQSHTASWFDIRQMRTNVVCAVLNAFFMCEDINVMQNVQAGL